MKYKVLVGIGIFITVIIATLIIEILMIKYSGKPVAVPDIPRGPETLGTGKPLTFVVFGDSTSVGQGSTYDRGIARNSARHIAAKGNTVTLYNFGVSGAVAAEVLNDQLKQAREVRPDAVLIAVGANDVTHFTKPSEVRTNLAKIIQQLQSVNPEVRIVLSGSPQMGSVPRFPQPIRYFAGVRTASINKELTILQSDTVILAPLAAETGKLFSEHPELFAQDNFHPTSEGYESWMPTFQRAFDKILDSN